MAYLLDPPGRDEDTAEIWQDVRDAGIAVLPRWARQMYGYAAPPPLTRPLVRTPAVARRP